MASSPLRLSIVADPAHLDALRPAWNDLLSRSAVDEPMLSPLWLLPWWQYYGEGTGRELRLGLFYEGDRLVGLALLQRRRYLHRPCLPFRRLEFLGADVDENDGVASDYLSIVAERGLEERLAHAFVTALAEQAWGAWDEIVLSPMDGEHPQTALLLAEFVKAGYRPQQTVRAEAPYILLPDSWDEYLAKLPGEKRSYLNRSLRDFEAWAGGDWQLHEAATAEQVAEGKRILTSLHCERWRADEPIGTFFSGRFSHFHDVVMPALFAENRLDLTWLSVRGEPIAALYNFHWQNKVYYYQTGRKLDVPKGVRAGAVILIHAVRRAIAARQREFDFLAGAVQYKMKMASATRPLVQVRVARLSLVEGAKRLADLAIAQFRMARHAVRRVRSWWKKH